MRVERPAARTIAGIMRVILPPGRDHFRPRPNPPSFLDFPGRSPYTHRVFKLSVACLGALGQGIEAGLVGLPECPGVVVHRRTRVMPTGTIARLLIDKGFGFKIGRASCRERV